MSQTVIAVEEIEPVTGDTLDTIRYVTCDFCHAMPGTCTAKGLPEPVWYRFLDYGGEIVCGYCLPKVEAPEVSQ